MKTSLSFLSVAVLLLVPLARGAESFNEALSRTSLEYAERLRQAGVELNITREKIARDKIPMLRQLRAAEDRVLAAEDEISRLETSEAQSQENRRRLARDAELLHKNESYLSTLAQDSLKAFSDGLAPGELSFVSERLGQFQNALADPTAAGGVGNSLEITDFLLHRVEKSLGGYAVRGASVLDGDNRVLKGTFAFMGPETYFRSDDSGAGGVVMRMHEGAAYPSTRILTVWPVEATNPFFQGKTSLIPADVTAGKAVHLQATRGNLWQHVQKGGPVAYAIVAVGLLSLLLMFLKARDLAQMSVDTPESVARFLSVFRGSSRSDLLPGLARLKKSTRELFQAGLRNLESPKVILEERLQAVILRQRLHFERRLPLLAVIATAAPLMGLLGTVVGMVRTFALITVFGTGNAAKLASGISEVLVATELGLIVAIPTLVVHGFLSQRIQRNLALLERYALEFVTASQLRTAGTGKVVSV